MKYNELVTEFCRANEEGKTIEGYIVFSPDSFEKPYPLQSRTYLLSSDNKAFKNGMTSNSIFGSALDGSDNGVRLDLYMKDASVPDGWDIEDCGLMSYQVFETYDRSTTSKGTFPTHSMAYQAMMSLIKSAFGDSEDDIKKRIEEKTCGVSSSGGWAKNVGKRGYDFSWRIVRLFNDGRLIRTEQEMNEPTKG